VRSLRQGRAAALKGSDNKAFPSKTEIIEAETRTRGDQTLAEDNLADGETVSYKTA
jgi:hypothetical protein